MNTIIKCKIWLVIVVTLISTNGFSQESGELTIPLTDPSSRAKITVDLRRGSITVVGSSRNDVLIKYQSREDKSKSKSSSNTKDGLTRISGGALDLEAYESDNKVVLESDSYNKGVDVTLEVPRNSDLHVETYNSGDIKVSNIEGDVVAENYNGEIELLNISGSAIADTYNGEIKVTFNSIKPDTPMAFSTYNGDVDVTFPAGMNASLKMKSSRGDIYSGFETSVQKNSPVQKKDTKSGVYKVYIDDWVRASINGGGPEFTFKNYNGDIYIRKK